MARSLQLEATKGHCETAEHGLMHTDDFCAARTAWITTLQPATRNNLQVTAHWHVAYRLWLCTQGEATALQYWTTSGRGAYTYAAL